MCSRFNRILSIIGTLFTLVSGFLSLHYLILTIFLVADGDPIPQGAIGSGLGLLVFTICILLVFPRYDEIRLVHTQTRQTVLLLIMFIILVCWTAIFYYSWHNNPEQAMSFALVSSISLAS